MRFWVSYNFGKYIRAEANVSIVFCRGSCKRSTGDDSCRTKYPFGLSAPPVPREGDSDDRDMKESWRVCARARRFCSELVCDMFNARLKDWKEFFDWWCFTPKLQLYRELTNSA